MKVKLINSTPDAEKTILYIARVSNPVNQASGNTGLLSYCIKNQHWSIFEMADMCVEIETSRAISAQILRHRSFVFQEFSQRYAEVTNYETYPARRQDNKNRQNSIADLPDSTLLWFAEQQVKLAKWAFTAYNDAIELGIAKEQARFLLPMSTSTKLYMKGNLRSWITYIQLRSGNGTQLEHQAIALECKRIFTEQFPIIAEAAFGKPTT